MTHRLVLLALLTVRKRRYLETIASLTVDQARIPDSLRRFLARPSWGVRCLSARSAACSACSLLRFARRSTRCANLLARLAARSASRCSRSDLLTIYPLDSYPVPTTILTGSRGKLVIPGPVFLSNPDFQHPKLIPASLSLQPFY